jgi:hypothetical protein
MAEYCARCRGEKSENGKAVPRAAGSSDRRAMEFLGRISTSAPIRHAPVFFLLLDI